MSSRGPRDTRAGRLRSGYLRPSLLLTHLLLLLLQLHYQYQVVQSLHRLWRQYAVLLPKEAWPSEEEPLGPRALVTVVPSSYLEKTPGSHEHHKVPGLEAQRQETKAFRDSRDSAGPQKTGAGTKSAPQKSIMEEILVEETLNVDGTLSSWDLDGLALPKWNLCLEYFRKVLARPWEGMVEGGPGAAGCQCPCPAPRQRPQQPPLPTASETNLLRAQREQALEPSLYAWGTWATAVKEGLPL